MFPSPGFEVSVRYLSDDGLVYGVATTDNLLLQGSWDAASVNNPILPWYVQPRHLLCLYSDGVDRAELRLLVPEPFQNLPFAIPAIVFTQGGLALTVIARIGEISQPLDAID